MRISLLAAIVAGAVGAVSGFVTAAPPPPVARFLDAASTDDKTARAALDEIVQTWRRNWLT